MMLKTPQDLVTTVDQTKYRKKLLDDHKLSQSLNIGHQKELKSSEEVRGIKKPTQAVEKEKQKQAEQVPSLEDILLRGACVVPSDSAEEITQEVARENDLIIAPDDDVTFRTLEDDETMVADTAAFDESPPKVMERGSMLPVIAEEFKESLRANAHKRMKETSDKALQATNSSMVQTLAKILSPESQSLTVVTEKSQEKPTSVLTSAQKVKFDERLEFRSVSCEDRSDEDEEVQVYETEGQKPVRKERGTSAHLATNREG